MKVLRGFFAALIAVVAACSSTNTSVTPRVAVETEHRVSYEGPEVLGELAHRWASAHLGDDWLLLKLSLVAAGSSAPLVERGSIRVRTPDGRVLPLIDPAEFRRAHPRLRLALDRMDAWGPPRGRLAGFRDPCGLWFLAPPFTMADRATLRVLPGRWCSGPLVFAVPIGVQPGRWVLQIDLEESRVRIPFVLGE